MINLFLITAEYHQRNYQIKLEPRFAAVQAAKSLRGDFKYTRQQLAFHTFEVFVKGFFWVVFNADNFRIGKMEQQQYIASSARSFNHRLRRILACNLKHLSSVSRVFTREMES